jgi:putative transposase
MAVIVVTACFRVVYVFVALESRFATADSFQCDRTSDGGMDFPTATGSTTGRSGIQVPATRPPQDLLCWIGRGSRELGIQVLKSPAHAPTANAFCERLIGTIRRECLDYVIPLSESHLKSTLQEWVNHYNTAVLISL